jgi:hypothetical protein
MIRWLEGVPVMYAVGSFSHLHWKVGAGCQHHLIPMLLLMLLLPLLLLLRGIMLCRGISTCRFLHPHLPMPPLPL